MALAALHAVGWSHIVLAPVATNAAFALAALGFSSGK
jgi:hypothetical protein